VSGGRATLVVVEPDPALAVSFLPGLVLGAQLLDDLLLLSVDQAGKDAPEEVPGLEDEIHGWSDAQRAKGGASGTGIETSIGWNWCLALNRNRCQERELGLG
jgi:hypothetical protein